MFDPVISNYFDPHPLLNLDTVWTKNLTSDHTSCTGINSLMAADQHQPLHLQPSQQESTTPRGSSTTADHHHHQQQPPAARNPKKRSRASRRAPTTVLTTDTTNFRAMVQEFTGIPAPPFTPTSAFRTRLDLFGTGAASAATIRGGGGGGGNTALDPLQTPYLLRPFAQKIQLPFAPSSSATPTTTPTTTTASGGQNGNLLSMQNQILTLQSLLQPPPSLVHFGSSRTPGSMGMPGVNDSHLKMGLVDEYGLGQAHLTGLHGLVSPPAARTENDNTGNNPVRWADELGLNDVGSQIQNQSRTVNAGGSDAVGNVSGSRGEGMMESWICPSD